MGDNNPYQSPASANYGTRPPGAQYANCPKCQRNGATRVGWSIWGGLLGPWLLTHVRCHHCGNKFNGKTGKSNTVAIMLYLFIPFAVMLVVFGGIACAGVVGALLDH